MRPPRTLPLVLSSLLLGSCISASPPDWPSLKREIGARFPEVPQISTQELSDWLESQRSPRPILLDARKAEEFAVSHLRGAQLATSESEALRILGTTPGDQPVVVYCSVGYRSSALAEKLRARGFMNVSNLEGSLFEWANEGRPLHRGEKRVEVVHPYDERWGRFLDRKLWSPPASSP